MIFKKLVRNGYTVEIDAPYIFVDNNARGRSGHMTHAMAEFSPGCFIDFNSNCSNIRQGGHFPYGWVEYRISEDCGNTFTDFYTLEYSYKSFIDGIYAISVEKAVATNTGRIVAFCLRNDAQTLCYCTPWATPTLIVSDDFGKNWSEPKEYSPYRGRTYDALYKDGKIYVLHLCNENFIGETDEHVYRLYTSADNGETFEEASIIPINPIGRAYGAMLFDEKGALHAFAYNVNAEKEMDHAISKDCGKTWEIVAPCYLAKGIRNPQIALIDGVYILHGRAGDSKGFVIYTSTDCYNWDEGYMLVPKENVAAFYSNNLNLTDEKGNFLLVQYSDNYRGSKVNVMHTKIRIKK